MKPVLLLAFVLLAAALGAATSLFGGEIVMLAVVAMLPLPIIFKDYRAGAILLTFLLPISAMLPAIRGLNILSFVTVASLASFFLNVAFSKAKVVWLPKPLLYCLVLPVTVAIVIAWPHIPEGVRNYPELANARTIFDPAFYVVTRYVKPLFYYLSYAFLLANAVRSSQRPERFIVALAASAMLPALAVFYSVATYPGSFADVARDRGFMAARGMHANEFGMLLALASGPLLFLVSGARQRRLQVMALAAFGVVTLGLLLTFSRGGLLAYVVVVAGYLVHHKRVKTFLIGLVVIVAAVLAAPQALHERFETGLRVGALSDVSNVDKDDLTAGRVHGWMLLAPEVMKSPWIGRGLGSTQWSSAVVAGRYGADHPHNIYLEILMDLGVLGLCAMLYLHIAYLRRMRQLAADPSLPDELRSFFLGARYALLGMLVEAATTAYYMPNAAQAYFWFSLGLLFAFWRVPQPVSTPMPARRWRGGAQPDA